MGIIETVVLAIVQGLSEFLPISSSAHLIITSWIFDWQDQGLMFDVAVHFGTLLAVCCYFYRELWQITIGFTKSLTGKTNEDGKLGWLIIIATIPAGLAGLLLDDLIAENLRNPLVIAISTIIFAFLLAYAWTKRSATSLSQISLRIALIVGFAQALALIPGTSRSGITMTAALLCGVNATDSARFSFLLSIPLIAAAFLLQVLKTPNFNLDTNLIIAISLSCISALCCIHLFLKALTKIGMMPFVYYRIALGLALLVMVL